MTNENDIVDEIIEEEWDAAFGEIVTIGLTHEQVSKMIPTIITPSGIVKKYPDFKADRSVKAVIGYGAMVASVTRQIGNNPELAHLTIINTPAGQFILKPEITMYFDGNEMWIDLAAKGWTYAVTPEKE